MSDVITTIDNSESIKREMRENLKAAERRAAEVSAGIAERDCPRLTGALASTVIANGPAGDGTVTAGGSRAPYGGIVEHRKPFMRPAFDATRDSFEEDCRKV